MKLNSTYKRKLDKAKINRYLASSARRNDPLHNAFYHWCEENAYPCIEVSEGQKYASVYINFDPTESIIDNSLNEGIHNLYNKYGNENISISISTEVCFLEKIPIEYVEDFIKELLTLFSQFYEK